MCVFLYFKPLFGEESHFDAHVLDGLKPPSTLLKINIRVFPDFFVGGRKAAWKFWLNQLVSPVGEAIQTKKRPWWSWSENFSFPYHPCTVYLLYNWLIFMVDVGEYIYLPYMDGMGFLV